MIPFLLTLLALLADMDKIGSYLLSGFSAMGGIVGVYFFAAVGADGSLVSGTQLLTSAAAATAQTWQVIVLLPLVFALMAFMSAIYRGWKA